MDNRYIFILVMLLIIPTNHVEASEKKYLVLVQRKDGKWIAYDNLTEVTDSGSVMLKAKDFSDIMGFTYTENTKKKQFSIKRSKTRYNTYTINSKKYTYTNNNKKTNKEAKYKSYQSKSDKSKLCIAASVNTLCKYKLFTGNNIKEYQALGYDGIVCYSFKGEIDKVPNILFVRYADGRGLKKRLSTDKNDIYLNLDSSASYVNIELFDADIDGMKVGVELIESSEEVISYHLGEFVGGNAPLTIKPKSEGVVIIGVFLEDKSEYMFITVHVESTPDSAESDLYINDEYFSITGKLSYTKEGKWYRYTFNGKITNITSEMIELGSTKICLYREQASNPSFIYSSSVLNLEPGMSKPVSFEVISDFLLFDVAIKNTDIPIVLKPGMVLPDGTIFK